MYYVIYFVLVAVGAYFFGGLNGAILTSRLVYGEDIRRHGSGNAGMTNFLRTYGRQAAFLMILIDVTKTALPVIAGGMVFESLFSFATVDERMIIGRTFAAFFAMLGHAYPCLHGFKGGKGVLAGGTAALFLDGYVFLIVIGVFVLVTLATRYVSLGSMLAGLGLPITFIIFGMNLWATLIAALCGVFIVFRHRDNILRLLSGQERRLSFGKKREGDRS